MMTCKNLIIAFFILKASLLTAQSNLQFDANERESGTAFFALDGNTGQLYYMLDYSDNAGNWKAYGSGIGSMNGGFLFATNERTDGTVFFAMHQTSGQVYYMLDYGDNAGEWKSYGGTIPSKSKDGYTFVANERKDGSAFFSTDKTTGQLYYMLDYGDNAGVWKAYGGTVGK